MPNHQSQPAILPAILEVKGLKKFFPSLTGEDPILLFENLNFSISPQEKVAIVGPSGCGKSTLLSLLAGLEQPTAGEIFFDGQAFSTLKEKMITRFRAEKMGIVFQQFHLLGHLTALENVELPLEILNHPTPKQQALNLLERVGMEPRKNHFPAQLSGGEKQRVAIARALSIKPKLLLSDEPTGSLDDSNSAKIMDLFFQLVEENHSSLVVVTHNWEIAQACDRILAFQKGFLVEKSNFQKKQ